jgi:hypothetical protein
MKRVFTTMIVALAVLMTLTVSAQNDPKAKGLEAITDDLVKAQLNFLASDWTEGREAVSKGAFLAADYIASVFQMTGLAPAGDILPNGTRSYFQRVPLIRTTVGDTQSLSLITNAGVARIAKNYVQGTDYMVQSGGDVSRNISAPIVFIGYGMVDETNGYDELKGIDMKGKIVVRLSGYPGHRDTLSAAYEKFKLQPPASGRPQRMVLDPRFAAARTFLEKGALAIVTVMPDKVTFSTQFATNATFYPNQRLTPTSYGRVALYSSTPDETPMVITVSPRLGADMLGNSFIEEFEKNAAKTMKPQSSLVQGKSMDVVSTVKSELVMGVNVCAMIKGKNPDQNIVIGGHYDHLGTNGAQIWNGADDDASGTVAAMSIGRAFVASGVQPPCNIIFAAWTAEEKGLLGSRYFVETFPNMNQIVMNMNFDMIARDDSEDTDKKLVEFTYTDTYPQWLEICKANIEKYKLPVGLREDPRPVGYTAGTDFAPFSTAGRPFISWFTGYHPDYHQYTDKLNQVNWQKCIGIIRLGYLNMWDIAQQVTE